MTRERGLGFPSDELLVGILLAVVGVAIGGTLGTYAAMSGGAIGLGAYLVAVIATLQAGASDTEHTLR
jgi:hypothetical protein